MGCQVIIEILMVHRIHFALDSTHSQPPENPNP